MSNISVSVFKEFMLVDTTGDIDADVDDTVLGNLLDEADLLFSGYTGRTYDSSNASHVAGLKMLCRDLFLSRMQQVEGHWVLRKSNEAGSVQIREEINPFTMTMLNRTLLGL